MSIAAVVQIMLERDTLKKELADAQAALAEKDAEIERLKDENAKDWTAAILQRDNICKIS